MSLKKSVICGIIYLSAEQIPYSNILSKIMTESNNVFPYRKILIVGCGGAGKSTLAVALGKKLGLPVVHLDKLLWKPNWQSRTESEFDALLLPELEKPSWIIEGNFARTLARRLEYAELCIFLDYPTELCIRSVHERVEKYRGMTRPDMTEGCTEQVDPEFEAWIRSFDIEVKPKMLETMAGSGVPYELFRSREQAAEWLNGLSRL